MAHPQLMEHAATPLAVIVLAAGKGTRMDSDLPKALHPMAGKPMLAHVLGATNGLHPAHTVVVTGVGAAEVEAEAHRTIPKAIFVRQTEQRGTGHAVAQTQSALATFTGTVVIVYADTPLLTTEVLHALLHAHITSQAQVTVLSTQVENPTHFGRIIRTPQGTPLGIVEEQQTTPEQKLINEVNTGIYAVESKTLYNLINHLKPTPPKGELYLTDILHLACQNNLPVTVTQQPGGHDLLGCNTPTELAAATTRYNQRQAML